jgi:hypothetical protein
MLTGRAIQTEIMSREALGQSPAQAAIEALQASLLGGFGERQARSGGIAFEMSEQDKEQVRKQIEVLEALRAEFAAARQQPVRVQPQQMRPKEAPLPAATAP